jgi:hypothetical protein
MGLEIGTITALISLDATRYRRGAEEAREVNRSLGESFTNFVTNPVTLTVGAITAAGGAAAIYANRALDLATANQRLADRTKLSVETIQALRGEFNRTGRDVKILAPAMNALFQAIAAGRNPTSEQADVFRQLGIDLRSIGDGDTALRAVVDALNAIPDPIRRAGVAAKVFGGDVGTIVTSAIASSDAIDRMVARGRNLGTVLDGDTNAALVKLNAQLASVKQGVDGLALATAAEFFAGFESSAGNIDAAAQRVVGTLRSELAPLARELGESTGTWAENVEDIAEYVDNLVQGVKVVSDLLGPLFDKYAAINGFAQGAITDVTAFALSGGTTRSALERTPDDIRRLQEARGNAR